MQKSMTNKQGNLLHKIDRRLFVRSVRSSIFAYSRNMPRARPPCFYQKIKSMRRRITVKQRPLRHFAQPISGFSALSSTYVSQRETVTLTRSNVFFKLVTNQVLIFDWVKLCFRGEGWMYAERQNFGVN